MSGLAESRWGRCPRAHARCRSRERTSGSPGRRPALFENPRGGFTILSSTRRRIREVEAVAARRLVERGLPAAWSSVGVVYEDPYILVLRDAVPLP